MSDRREGEDALPTQLERLGAIVEQRSNDEIWRKFLVAQATVVQSVVRRREMTTQRIFLIGSQT
jgi:hypothetical protein